MTISFFSLFFVDGMVDVLYSRERYLKIVIISFFAYLTVIARRFRDHDLNINVKNMLMWSVFFVCKDVMRFAFFERSRVGLSVKRNIKIMIVGRDHAY